MIFSHPHPLLSNSSFLPFICLQNPPALVWELIKDPKLLGKDTSLHSSSAPPLTFHGCEQKGTVCISPLYGMRIGGQFGEDVGAHRENIHKPQGNCASIVFFSLGTHTILYPRLCSSFLLSCLLINGIVMTRIQSAFDTSRSAIWTTNSWCKGTTYQLLGCLMSVKERYEMKTQNQPRPLRIVRRQRKRRNWALRVENKLRTEELKWKISIQPVMWITCGLLLYSQPFITESILTYIYSLRSIVLIRAVGQRKNL